MIQHVKIFDYALSSLLRRKYKNSALILAFSFTIFALSSILFFTDSLKTEAAVLLSNSPDLLIQKTKAGRHDFIPVSRTDKIKEIPGVADVAPRYWGYYYDALTKSNFTVLGLDKESANLKLLKGRLPENEGEAAIGAGVAQARNSEVNGELVLIDSENIGVIYDVVGVFKDESILLTNDLVVLGKQDFLSFFNFPADKATDIAVTVYNSQEVQTIAAKVRRLFPDARPITKSELVRTYEMVFNWRSGMMLTMFSGAVVAFCIMAWDKASGISAEEKKEIGILKAIGWDTSDVLVLKFWEGLIIALSSCLLGILSGFLHVFFFKASILASIIKGWSVLFPEFQLAPQIDLYQLFILSFLIITPYVACTVIPAWKSAITDPDIVMRG